MYKTSEQMGLTPTEIDKIIKDLWLNEKPRETCPDCGVQRNQKHKNGCDVSVCTECGHQRLSCDCQNGDGDVWTGWWPGIAECRDAKLICTYDNGVSWIFDLNEYYRTKV